MDQEEQPLLTDDTNSGSLIRQHSNWKMGKPGVKKAVKKYLAEACSIQAIKGKFPVTKWLPQYSFQSLQCDIVAGITVGMTVIPQGLAYAKIARLPAQYGLYSAFMGCFLYALFGTAKDVTLGPTAIMSLMTERFAVSPVSGDATYAIILCFICGIIQFTMGILHLGILVNFISFPVINGFTSAAAITIAVGQVKGIFGLKDIRQDFVNMVGDTFSKIKETNLWDMTLGLSCIVVLYLLKIGHYYSLTQPGACIAPDHQKLRIVNWKDKHGDPPLSIGQKVSRKFIWLIGTGANAVLVVTAAGIAASLLAYNIDKLSLTGSLKSGLPPFQPPKFSLKNGNTTITSGQIFGDIGIGLLLVPLLGIIESVAIGKAFARRNDYKIQPNQELLAIGIANIASSFVSSYPITGSFARTAVNSQSGVKTPAASIVTGVLVILALQLLTPLFYYIPTAALSAVILSAVLQMVDYKVVWALWRYKKIDLIPLFLTFISSFLLGIEYGILVGIGVSLLILLYPIARPHTQIYDNGVSVVMLDQGLQYPAIDYIQNVILDAMHSEKNPRSVVLDCSKISYIDYSTIQGIMELVPDFERNDVRLVLAGLKSGLLRNLQLVDIPEVLYSPTVAEASELLQNRVIQNKGHTVVVGDGEAIDGEVTRKRDRNGSAYSSLLFTDETTYL